MKTKSMNCFCVISILLITSGCGGGKKEKNKNLTPALEPIQTLAQPFGPGSLGSIVYEKHFLPANASITGLTEDSKQIRLNTECALGEVTVSAPAWQWKGSEEIQAVPGRNDLFQVQFPIQSIVQGTVSSFILPWQGEIRDAHLQVGESQIPLSTDGNWQYEASLSWIQEWFSWGRGEETESLEFDLAWSFPKEIQKIEVSLDPSETLRTIHTSISDREEDVSARLRMEIRGWFSELDLSLETKEQAIENLANHIESRDFVSSVNERGESIVHIREIPLDPITPYQAGAMSAIPGERRASMNYTLPLITAPLPSLGSWRSDQNGIQTSPRLHYFPGAKFRFSIERLLAFHPTVAHRFDQSSERVCLRWVNREHEGHDHDHGRFSVLTPLFHDCEEWVTRTTLVEVRSMGRQESTSLLNDFARVNEFLDSLEIGLRADDRSQFQRFRYRDFVEIDADGNEDFHFDCMNRQCTPELATLLETAGEWQFFSTFRPTFDLELGTITIVDPGTRTTDLHTERVTATTSMELRIEKAGNLRRSGVGRLELR